MLIGGNAVYYIVSAPRRRVTSRRPLTRPRSAPPRAAHPALEEHPALARLLVVDPASPDPSLISEAAAVLRGGGLVAFPTETVYGLGADALNAAAVTRIFAAKGRPADDPIIVHVLGFEALSYLAATVPPVAARLAAEFWPGPLTLVVPRGPHVPDIVTAGLDSVAVRAPAHPVARALLAAVGGPIAAPSANPFGQTSPTTAAHVVADLGDRIDVVLDGGPSPVGVESTVVDCRVDPPVVLRHGGVTIEALRAVVPSMRGGPDAGTEADSPSPARMDSPSRAGMIEAQPAPGMLARHYAPHARLVLVSGPADDVREALRLAAAAIGARGQRVGLLVADEDLAVLAAGDGSECGEAETVVVALGPLGDPVPVARRLFGTLRNLDALGVDVILARDFGEAGLGLAIRDRLTRAGEGRLVQVVAGGAAEGAARIIASLS